MVIIKNAEVKAINKDGVLLLTIESKDEINPMIIVALTGKMDVELSISKDSGCAWQEKGKCTKGYHLGEPVRLWWSERICFGNPCP